MSTPQSTGALPSPEQQRAALDYINSQLVKSKTGRYASLPNAERMGERIQSSLVAQKILLDSRKYLRMAAATLGDFNFFDKVVGVQQANIDLLESNLNSINVAEKELPSDPMAPLPGLLAAKVALIALQCLDNLNFTRQMVAESVAEASMVAIINQFGDALAMILREAMDNIVVPLIEQAPEIVWSFSSLIIPAGLAVGGFFLVKSFIASKAA